MTKHAYVVFCDGSRKLPYIVPVSDIKDFAPKACSDFKRNLDYSVKWARSNSDLGVKSDYHPAKIYCLGATADEVLVKADELNLKTPQLMLLNP